MASSAPSRKLTNGGMGGGGPGRSSSAATTHPQTVSTSSERMKYCVVLGCKNTGMELNVWKRTPCASHNHKFRAKCGCPPPFVLYPFPNSDKLRKMWQFRIGLPELDINDATCICSIHFLEGRPTSTSFFPTLSLQLENEDELIDDEEDEEENDYENGDDFEMQESDIIMPVIRNSFHFDARGDRQFLDNGEEEQDMCDGGDGNYGGDVNFNQEGASSSSSSSCTEQNTGINSQTNSHHPGQSKNEQKGTDGGEDDVKVLFQSNNVSKPLLSCKQVPLAQYNPNAETLHITDPVKYIMECHNKISHLVSENKKLRQAHEKEVSRLKACNRSLREQLMAQVTCNLSSKPKLQLMSTPQTLRSPPPNQSVVEDNNSYVARKPS
ncbi:uncharacterized protein LOC110841774 [Folsomia candida]|nr:uncharacterized protein LOC110841774 [Folsomia candida]